MVKKKTSSIFGWIGVVFFRAFLGFAGWSFLKEHQYDQQRNQALVEMKQLYKEMIGTALSRDAKQLEKVIEKLDHFLSQSSKFLNVTEKESLEWMTATFKKLFEVLHAIEDIEIQALEPKDFVNSVLLWETIDKLKKSIELGKEVMVILESIFTKSKNAYADHAQLLEGMKILIEEGEKLSRLVIEMYQFLLDKQGKFILEHGQLIRYHQKDLTQLQNIVRVIQQQEKRLMDQQQQIITNNKDREQKRDQRMKDYLNTL